MNSRIPSRGEIRTRLLPLGLMAGLVLALAAVEVQGAPAAAAVPNLLFISAEGLRPDYLSCYGRDGSPQTPNIDSLAADGHLFERVLAPSASSLPSLGTLFTGQYPFEHGVWDDDYRNHLSADALTLAERLHRAGYRTAAFVGSSRAGKGRGLEQGFEVYEDGYQAPPTGVWMLVQRTGESVLPEALRWLEEEKSRPFFLWTHFVEPSLPNPSTIIQLAGESPATYGPRIRALDEQVGRLLSTLRETHRYEQTIVVITADHGYGLGEHAETRAGVFLYETTVRVPLILKTPGKTKKTGPRHAELGALIDVLPTLEKLLNLDRIPDLPGRDLLAPEARSTSAYYGVALMGREAFGWAPFELVAQGNLRLILGNSAELYDVARDPKQKEDLSSERVGLVKKLRELRHRITKGRQLPPPHFSPDASISKEDAARLREMGYAPIGRRNHETPSLPDARDFRDSLALLDEMRLRMQSHGALAVAPFEERLRSEAPESLLTLHVLAQILVGRAVSEARVSQEAVTLLKEAQRLFPRDSETYHMLGHDAFLRQRPGEAELFLRVALALYPLYPGELNYDLACAYSLQGKEALAASALQRAVSLGFRDLEHISRDPDLEPIRETPAYQQLIRQEFPVEPKR